jgi:CubicO group peptidase (beta-lactamase class C family)
MELHGFYHHDFRHAIDCFLERLVPDGRPGGAALTVYHGEEKVVDVWAGSRNRAGEPWREDTIACSFSTTKGVASTLLHIVMDRAGISHDDPVAKYWPGYAQHGKGETTIRQALCMEAGIHDIDNHGFDLESFLDWNTALEKTAAATPGLAPGSANAYHALNYGFLVGGLIEGITGKPFEAVLREELVEPLQLDGLYIGVPEAEQSRCADLLTADGEDGRVAALLKFTASWPSIVKKILVFILGLFGVDLQHTRDAMAFRLIAEHEADGARKIDFNTAETRAACIPGANGYFTARSLAKMYAMIANGGTLEGRRYLSGDTVGLLGATQNTRSDKVLVIPMHWRLGYHGAPSPFNRGPMSGFGFAGVGGSIAWCNPHLRLSMGLAVNSNITSPKVYRNATLLGNEVLRCTQERGLQGIGRQGPRVIVDGSA